MTARKPTKAEREARAREVQQEALMLHNALARIARGIHRTRDRDLIEAWQWFFSYWTASIGRTVDYEFGAQRAREAAIEGRRKFTDEEFDQADRQAKNDKDLARLLGVNATTVARYRAKQKRRPSLTDEMLADARAERTKPIRNIS